MASLRIAVTGKEGQVVRSLIERGSTLGVDVVPIGRPELDLANPSSARAAFTASAPDVIVNAAAYTMVDRAEQEPDLAMSINAAGAGAMAAAARDFAVPIVHLSTDYVFDGRSDRPYREDDQTSPLGAYGRSKLAGEFAVAEQTPNHVILRTAWVYSPFGTNFVKTMLRLAQSRKEISVVADQRGSPTYALEIADGVIAVAKNLVAQPRALRLRGVFHLTSAGATHWAEFAEAIFDASKNLGGPAARVRRICAVDYPTPARRPDRSELDCAKLATVHGVALNPWRSPIADCVARLLSESPHRGM